jgi:hypothetical protein
MEENSEENKKKRRNIFKNESYLRKRTRKRDEEKRSRWMVRF